MAGNMTIEERDYIEKLFDKKFGEMQKLFNMPIEANARDIIVLQKKTENHGDRLTSLEERIGKKIRFKYLLYGIPIALIIFVMQLLINGIMKALFP